MLSAPAVVSESIFFACARFELFSMAQKRIPFLSCGVGTVSVPHNQAQPTCKFEIIFLHIAKCMHAPVFLFMIDKGTFESKAFHSNPAGVQGTRYSPRTDLAGVQGHI